jgi:metal-dependent amidase/aminoacylase/carboxypeptidase family protein
MLLSFGIEEDFIKPCVGTGLVVDIVGTGEETQGGVNSIALRADMDALPIPENNPTLPYQTTQLIPLTCVDMTVIWQLC